MLGIVCLMSENCFMVLLASLDWLMAFDEWLQAAFSSSVFLSVDNSGLSFVLNLDGVTLGENSFCDHEVIYLAKGNI